MLNKSNIDPEEAIGDRLGFVKTFSIYINCVYSKEVRRGWGGGFRDPPNLPKPFYSPQRCLCLFLPPPNFHDSSLASSIFSLTEPLISSPTWSSASPIFCLKPTLSTFPWGKGHLLQLPNHLPHSSAHVFPYHTILRISSLPLFTFCRSFALNEQH